MENTSLKWETISLTTSGTLDYDDLLPLLKELHKRYATVNTSVSSLGVEPPAAGMTEIALIFALSNTAIPYLKGFLEEWGKADAKGLREALIELFGRGRKSRTGSGRMFIPLVIPLGKVRFYFYDVRSDDDFANQLNAAYEFMQSLPNEAFEGIAGPPEYGMFWDRESNSWQGSIYGYTEYKSHPRDLWTE
jgi:hypothetical protein